MEDGRCTFCGIVSGRIPANVRHEDDEVVVFDNELKWVPVMLVRLHQSDAPEAWREYLYWTAELDSD